MCVQWESFVFFTCACKSRSNLSRRRMLTMKEEELVDLERKLQKVEYIHVHCTVHVL